MHFSKTSLEGLFIIELEPRKDERGYFARTYCELEFATAGLNTRWPQCNLTLTTNRGMVRGMHFQAPPKPETKLVRCSAGAIYDVVVDLRKKSSTFGKWEGFELTSSSPKSLYVPAGLAHGFQCLQDHCEVYYQMSEYYFPELARGIRWDDPDVHIRWPLPNSYVSPRDMSLPFLTQLE
jgi:dTDP-4-dehydrorhamnose 3,5-epimerase